MARKMPPVVGATICGDCGEWARMTRQAGNDRLHSNCEECGTQSMSRSDQASAIKLARGVLFPEPVPGETWALYFSDNKEALLNDKQREEAPQGGGEGDPSTGNEGGEAESAISTEQASGDDNNGDKGGSEAGKQQPAAPQQPAKPAVNRKPSQQVSKPAKPARAANDPEKASFQRFGVLRGR